MTDGAHDAGGGFGRSAGANVARGVMVIVGAVIIGLLLMNRGLGDSQAEADAGGTSVTTTTAAEGAGEVEETPSTTASTAVPTTLGAPRDPSEVAVLVINSTAGEDGQPLEGVAGRGTNVLKTNNYITRDPKNGTAGPSVVYFAEGFESEALAVAAVLGVADPASVVQALDPAAPPIADIQEASVIVRIGSDGVIQV
ncbi:MAG: hypothetical protein ACI8TP_001804 [Acidimicrobiales bacterium]|jgi:hypothetical protein